LRRSRRRPESRVAAVASVGYRFVLLQQMASRVCCVYLMVGKLFVVENAEVGSEVEQEELKKEAMAGVGETLRSFMEVSTPLDVNSWRWRLGILMISSRA
jgi:hypothetical protein